MIACGEKQVDMKLEISTLVREGTPIQSNDAE
jgi:hypothetical protein